MSTIKNICTEDELEIFINEIFTNLKDLETSEIHFDSNLFTIQLKIEGSKYNSSITTSVMKYMLNIQSCFYKLFKQYTGKSPSKAERQRLEISVRVENGCSNIITSLVEQLNVIQEVIRNMTGTQTLVAIISALILWSVVKIHNRRADSCDKKITAEAEIEKEKTQNDREKIVFDTIINTIKILNNFRTQGLKDLSKIGDSNIIEIDNKPITKDELLERIKERSLPEKEVIATSKIYSSIKNNPTIFIEYFIFFNYCRYYK